MSRAGNIIWAVSVLMIVVPLITQFFMNYSITGKFVINIVGESYYDSLYRYVSRLTPLQSLYLSFASILIQIINALLQYGYEFHCLKMARGEEVGISDLFDGFYRPGRILLAQFIINVKIFFGVLCFVIPGIMMSYSYTQTFRVLADDPDVTASEAINLSRDMMRGNRMDYFMLQLSFFFWLLLGAFTYDITSIYLNPYMTCASSFFYEDISNHVARPDDFDVFKE